MTIKRRGKNYTKSELITSEMDLLMSIKEVIAIFAKTIIKALR